MFALPLWLCAAPVASQTQLLSAARKGDLPLIKRLIAKGAKVNMEEGAFTPLMGAAQSGKASAVSYLVSKGAKLEATDRPGYFTALLYAKNYACVKALLKAGADANASDVDGESVLMRWLDRGDTEALKVIRLLIVKGAEVNCSADAGETGLMRAVEAGNATIVRLLLAKGAKTSGEDEGGEMALAKAHRKKRADLVAALKRAGAKK